MAGTTRRSRKIALESGMARKRFRHAGETFIWDLRVCGFDLVLNRA
jgi:hypothetical protein